MSETPGLTSKPNVRELPPAGAAAEPVAVIDIGASAVRLVVAQIEPDHRPVVLEEASRGLLLGKDTFANGKIGSATTEAACRALDGFRRIMEGYAVRRVRAVATSAVREAANRAGFVARLEGESGERVEVGSGEEEARLTLKGVTSGLPGLGPAFVLFDIGGGSTEFVLARDGAPAAAVSLRLGVVRLQEEWGEPGPVRWDRFAALRRHVEARLAAEVPEEIAGLREGELVGTAGTVTTLAALDLGLEVYDASRVHGHRLPRAGVERELARLGALDVAARARLGCLEPGRADVIIPGIAICLATMTRFRRETLRVSDRGLREGILCELLEAAA